MEERSDSKLSDALLFLSGSGDEQILTRNYSSSVQEQGVSCEYEVIFINSKKKIVNAKQRRSSSAMSSSGESDDYNSTPQKVDIESETKYVKMSPDYTLSGSAPKCQDGEMLKKHAESKPSNQDSSVKFGTMDPTNTEVCITLDSNSRDQELVVGTIRLPGAEKWGDIKPKSPNSIMPQEKSPRSSIYSEELTTPRAPSTTPRTTIGKSEQLPGNELDNFAVRAAADCLHAQDFTRMLEVLDSSPNETPAVLFGRGFAHYRLKKYPEAIQNFIAMDSHVAALHLSQHSDIYLAHYYLGEIKLTCKNFKEAAKHYEKAAKSHCSDTLAKKYRMVQPSLASVYCKQGSAFRQAQLVMEAVQAYKKALTHANNRKDRLAAHTSLGNIYQSLGENKSAIEQYESTVCLADELGDHVSLGWAYGNMGNAWLGLFEKDKALKFLKKSLDLTILYEPTPQAIGRAYNNLGTAYQSINKLDQAREYYEMALNQAIYGMDEAGEARVRGNCGNLLMMQKEFDQAIVHYTATLSIAKDRSTKCTAYHNRGCASYEKNEIEKKKIIEKMKITGLKSSKEEREFYVTFTGPSMENEQRDHALSASLKTGYRKAQEDFSLVVQYHEETFQTMRGSSQGLNLSVSLFETNSRSFYRLQDCLYNLQEWWVALEYAEQSRARTLGELLLQRKFGQLTLELIAPLRTEQIQKIIEFVGKIVVYVSYTGARLLTWVFTPCADGKVITNMFQVAVEDDQFDGKSLDYYLRYLLADVLNEEGMDMYGYYRYENSPALNKLYHLFAKPLLTILDNVSDNEDCCTSNKDIILIPDSYTSLMPIFVLFEDDNDSNFYRRFLGDRFCFRIMPSILTLGILSQLPPAVVLVPKDSRKFCIVGNPSIPTFSYQGETWNLGKLPFATKEAESVAYILRCSPTLLEEATKNVVMSMISEAKVVHLATHGSAVSGFLAFASLSRIGAMADEKSVLLYPEEVEKLNISPALVVLSSCDSGRGMVKADGIQGMARAFILAGAQAVLTTLWRVPDESAAIFMSFFYQYMMDGFKSSHALQKAILSIRSFQKYSKYIHWSGYQLTGQEIEFIVKKQETKIGSCPVFPRLEVVRSLEKVLIKDCYLPTDVQIIHGAHGLRSAEPVLQFVANNYTHFPGGVFYVSGYNYHFLQGAEKNIREELNEDSLLEDKDSHVLLIFDGLLNLPSPSSFLRTLIQRNSTHIIFIIEENPFSTENLERQVDMALLRGTNKTKLLPLSKLHVTQRLVHGIMTKCEFTPYNREQDILANVAERSLGSSDLVDVISALLSKYIDEDEEENTDEFLERFHSEVCCGDGSPSCSLSYINCCSGEEKDTNEEKEGEGLDTKEKEDVNEKKEGDEETKHKKGEKVEPVGNSGRQPSKNVFISQLINSFYLSKTDFVFLSTLSLFGTAPLPLSLVEQIQMIVREACSDPQSIKTPLQTLISTSLLNHFPSPVITQPFSPLSPPLGLTESSLFCMPQIISEAVQECMDPKDILFSLSTANLGLYSGCTQSGDKSLISFLAGLTQVLLTVAEKQDEVIYRKIFKTYLSLVSQSCIV